MRSINKFSQKPLILVVIMAAATTLGPNEVGLRKVGSTQPYYPNNGGIVSNQKRKNIHEYGNTQRMPNTTIWQDTK